MSSWDKKLNSVTAVERRFASHPNSTNAPVGCSLSSNTFVPYDNVVALQFVFKFKPRFVAKCPCKI